MSASLKAVRIPSFTLCVALLSMSAHAADIVEFGHCSSEKYTSTVHLFKAIDGKPYIDVRSQIVARGWTPAPSSETSGWRIEEDDTTPVPFNGQEQPFADRNFSELEDCAEDRDAPCLFLFQDKQNDRLQIATSGEESPWSHAVVVPKATLACPPGKIPP